MATGNTNKHRQIVKATVFASCIDKQDYTLKMNLLNDLLTHYDNLQIPVSLISQPPLENNIVMEVWLLDYTDTELTFTFSRNEQASVLQIDSPEFSCLFSSQYAAKHLDFKQNAYDCFHLLDATLLRTNFDYSDIVRQWNYIEDITVVNSGNNKCLQNYQIFNDLRTLFYQKSNFPNGYPAATGIGMENGGCTIEVIALKEKTGNTVYPVTNAHQVDAHHYSPTVLIGNAIDEVKTISTPKFERGKSMLFEQNGFLFISGTASIIGELTAFPDDVAKQTQTTIQNIDHLIAADNLVQNRLKTDCKPVINNYRVYLKNEADYSIVKPLCDAHFGTENGIFVKAGICRDNLLIEIEANYRFQANR